MLERFDSQSTQRTMHSFLKFEQRFAKFQSKRLASAVKGIAGGALPEVCAFRAADRVSHRNIRICGTHIRAGAWPRLVKVPWYA